ncbi:MAG: 50S ribosomal protein L4 [Candidatus Peribacteraceae bacterium]
MTIDVFTTAGTKKGTMELPAVLFDAPINKGLIHQALVMQQSNRRTSIAHAKNRGEVQGSTRKLYAQKGTGRARRGSVRSPLLRGGGKAFGPRSNANFHKDMPRVMRHKALCSCLSLQAKSGSIIALESYAETVKTKEMIQLLSKLPVDLGRRILIVTDERHNALLLSGRNIPGITVITAAYLNPEDVLGARHIVFLVDALAKAEAVFGGKKEVKTVKKEQDSKPKKTAKIPEKEVKEIKKAPKKAAAVSRTKKSSTPKPKPKS